MPRSLAVGQAQAAAVSTVYAKQVGDGHHSSWELYYYAGVGVPPDSPVWGQPDWLEIRGLAGTLDGGPGDDHLRGRDERAQTVACGTGFDNAVAGPVDGLATDCEDVFRFWAHPPVFSYARVQEAWLARF